jgi:hypothetical protein
MFFRKPISKRQRFEILKRDGFRCHYCGRKPPEAILEIDHVKPVSGGGCNCTSNLITSCLDCNRGKGAMVLDDAKKSPFSEIWNIAKDLETEARECFNDHRLHIHDFIVISLLSGSKPEQIREAIESYSDGSYVDEEEDCGKEELIWFLRQNVEPYILNMEDPS